MSESTLVSRLVQDHSVLHIITSIRNDSHYGISTVRKVVHAISIMQFRPYDRRLSRLQAIQLLISAMLKRGRRSSHGLFTHLALVNITRTLNDQRLESATTVFVTFI